MEKNAPVRSTLLRVQLSVEFRTEQLRMMLEKGLMTPEDQAWLAPFLDPARDSPVQLKLERRRRGRPPAFPGAEGDALWRPLLGKLDMSELVRRLDAGTLSPADQGWLAALLDPTSDAPVRLVVERVPGAQPDPDRIVRQYQLGARADRLLTRARGTTKRMLWRIRRRLGCKRTEVYAARRLYLEVEAVKRDT